MFSYRPNRFVVVAAAGLAALTYAGVQAGSTDPNGDGCVDLQDYALFQGALTGPACVPAGTAVTPRIVKSYLAEDVSTSMLLVPVVAGDTGFVVTDVMLDGLLCRRLDISERNPASGSTELKAVLTSENGLVFHWNSGIAFAAGTEIWITPAPGQACDLVTISGHTQ